MHYVFAFLCVIPSMWVNVEAQLAIKAGLSMIAAVVGFAFLAPIFAIASVRAFQRWNPIAGCFWAAIAAIFMAVNMMIALSGISGVRDAAAEIRAEQIKSGADKQAIRDQVAELRKEVGVTSPGIVEAEMERLRGKKWDAANIRLQKTKLLASLEAKLDGWGAAIESDSPADPGVANVAALVVTLFNVRLDERFLAAVLSGSIALLLELGADLGPIAIVSLTRRPRHVKRHVAAERVSERVTSVAVQGGTNVPDVPPIVPPSCRNEGVRNWIRDRLETGPGRFAGTTVLAEDYNLWAQRHGCERLSITAMGATLRNLGYKKEKSGQKRYIGIGLRSQALRVVK